MSRQFWKNIKMISPALFLMAVTLTIYLPHLVFYANRAYYSDYFFNLTWPFVLIAVIISLLLSAVFSLIPKAVFKYICATFILCSLFFWLQGDYFIVDFGTLDGTILDFYQFRQRAQMELIIFIFLFVVSMFFADKINQSIPTVLWFISLAQIGIVAYKIYTEPEDKNVTLEVDNEINLYSSDKNIVLIVLDTFGADYFQKILNADPRVKDELAGFIGYTDAISNYPATKGSFPSMLTGQMIPHNVNYEDFLTHDLSERGLPQKFEDLGYSVSVVSTAYQWFKNAYKKRFLYQLPSSGLWFKYEGAQLMDLALFRAMPQMFKSMIYNKGQWVISQKKADNTNWVTTLSEKGMQMLKYIITHVSVSDSKPRFKILHVTIPHPEFVFTADCQIDYSIKWGEEAMLNQSKCALHMLIRLLRKYKELGIYDNSVIAVVSDHGSRMHKNLYETGFPTQYELETSGILFMIKGLNHNKPYKQIPNPVSLLSLYKTLLRNELNQNHFEEIVEKNRMFYSYKNKLKITNDRLSNGFSYLVNGHYSKPSSWQLKELVIRDCQPINLPLVVDFTEEEFCLDFGLSPFNNTFQGVWTEATDVRMLIEINQKDLNNQPLKLKIKAKTDLSPKSESLRTRWFVNKQLIGEYTFVENQMMDLEFLIPRDVVFLNKITELQITFPGIEPEIRNLNNIDVKTNGLFINEIKLNQ